MQVIMKRGIKSIFPTGELCYKYPSQKVASRDYSMTNEQQRRILGVNFREMCFLQICLIQCWLISSSGLYSSRAWWPLKPYFCSWATRQFCESYTRHPGFHRFSAQGSLQFFLEHSFEKFYKLFWIQACPEGIGTNGTQRSHARCHPCPIPQPVKVGHTTRAYVPQSF